MSKPPLATVVERFLTERRYLKNVTEVTDDLRELVLVGASGLELRRRAIEDGMITLRQSGLRKVKDGMTTIEEVARETVK